MVAPQIKMCILYVLFSAFVEVSCIGLRELNPIRKITNSWCCNWCDRTKNSGGQMAGAGLKFILKYKKIIGRRNCNNVFLWMPGRV